MVTIGVPLVNAIVTGLITQGISLSAEERAVMNSIDCNRLKVFTSPL